MLTINKITSHTTVDFAAEELKKYLRMMMPENGDIKIAYTPEARDGFRLGLMQDFGLDTSDAENCDLDDIIYIDCDTQGGIIAGSNARSVLLAVYEYFRQMGCRWLFPGLDGEYIPLKSISPVKYRKLADTRIRGNCIEGFVSPKIVTDFIEFMPKVGLNTFMIQFRVPTVFFSNYYFHWRNNANRPAEPITRQQAEGWSALVECEIAKRGLVLHSYGHGFTIDPFGIDSAMGDSVVNPEDYSEELMKNYALIDGKRQFFGNKPINTQLCMSNCEVRKKVVDYVVDYSRKHTNIDYLHIWLADSFNNHCECENCVKYRPSDLYVALLNEIDAALTAAKLPTRIVAIVYSDTFWAPIVEKLNNSKRFTLMLAPIERDYTDELDVNISVALPPYVRNKLEVPYKFGEIIGHFNEWKKNFAGDHFVFDYHFWWHQNCDLSGKMLAKRVYSDAKTYRSLGGSGVVECGTLRSFFPNGYPFYTHARTLFDASLSLEEIESDYYSHAYGDCWEKISKILEDMNETLPYEYVAPMVARRRETKYATPDYQERIAKAREIQKQVLALVKEHYNSSIRIHTASIRLLEHYAWYVQYFINIIEKVANGDKEGADAAMREFKNTAGRIEFYAEAYYDHAQAAGMIENNIMHLI